jgi:hypothetical protein
MPASTPAPPATLTRLHVTARPVIDVNPPYDDRDSALDDGLTEGALALALPPRPLPQQPGPPPPARPALELVPVPARTAPMSDLQVAELFDIVRTPRIELPAPGPRAAVLVRAILEALSGRRSLSQLVRWVSTEVYDELEVNVAPVATRTWAYVTRRLVVTEPADGVAEVAAVVQRGPRASALALRLEGLDGRWVVTALQLG